MTFLSWLKAAACHGRYGYFEEEFLCDMVKNLVRDWTVKEKLMELSDDELTLANVIKKCRQVELTRSRI